MEIFRVNSFFKKKPRSQTLRLTTGHDCFNKCLIVEKINIKLFSDRCLAGFRSTVAIAAVLGWIPSRGICLFPTFVLLFGITASLSEDEQL